MNRRVIEKILNKKHDDFVASIDDPAIRKLVNENSIITGGAIASMLLTETVNDYDYYFTTYETACAVADYYCRRFTDSNPQVSIAPVVFKDPGANPPRVKIVVKSAGVCSEAGDKGYQYFESLPDEVGQEYFEKVVAAADEVAAQPVDEAKPPYRPVFMSGNAITLSNKVQLVLRFWGDAAEIHRNYDYVHCTNYWTSKDRKLVLNPRALESLLAKTLYYQGSLYPICSVIRMRKFLKQGWYINAGQILKMLFQISELNLKDIKVLEDQLTGVDSAYFSQLITYCQKRMNEDKEFKITAPYLVTVIDKIFG